VLDQSVADRCQEGCGDRRGGRGEVSGIVVPPGDQAISARQFIRREELDQLHDGVMLQENAVGEDARMTGIGLLDLRESRCHRPIESSLLLAVGAEGVDPLAEQTVEKIRAGILRQETQNGCARRLRTRVAIPNYPLAAIAERAMHRTFCDGCSPTGDWYEQP
jgi:hypothetical protein